MIDDFGERIPGAAKDRRGQALAALSREIGLDAALARPLSEVFPAPDYRGMLEEGVSETLVAAARALREMIPTRPGASRPVGLRRWAEQLIAARDLTRRILQGEITEDDLVSSDRLAHTDRLLLKSAAGRIRAYRAAGHERSLKGWEIQPFLETGRWCVRKVAPGGRAERPIAIVDSKAAAIAAFRDRVLQADQPKPGKKTSKLHVYRVKNRSERPIVIGAKNRGQFIELEAFREEAEAFAYLQAHRGTLEERLKAMAQAPNERGDSNADRVGPDYRKGRAITPEIFEKTFGFRGVQFGNYMTTGDRQDALDNAFDALFDLAWVLRIEPEMLSLRGNLALAFGARGRGGRNPAAAHYEPSLKVINLTKHAGAGSLAHEWFHALDHSIAELEGLAFTFASQAVSPQARPRTGAFISLIREIAGTDLANRSRLLDQARSKPYYGMPEEMAARSFEAWIVDRLARRGARNDYLANFLDEPTYEAASRMMGSPEGRYPYPRTAELERIGASFDRLFDLTGLLSDFDPPRRTVEVPAGWEERDVEEPEVAPEVTAEAPALSESPTFQEEDTCDPDGLVPDEWV